MVLKVITILRPSSPFHTKSFVLLGIKIACWLKPYHRKSNSALILVSKKLYIAIRFTATKHNSLFVFIRQQIHKSGTNFNTAYSQNNNKMKVEFKWVLYLEPNLFWIIWYKEKDWILYQIFLTKYMMIL